MFGQFLDGALERRQASEAGLIGIDELKCARIIADWRRGSPSFKAKMFSEAADLLGIVDKRFHSHPPAAFWTLERVIDFEYALNPNSPLLGRALGGEFVVKRGNWVLPKRFEVFISTLLSASAC